MDNLKKEQKLHYLVIDDNFSVDSGVDFDISVAKTSTNAF